jgi:hypothetical protein
LHTRAAEWFAERDAVLHAEHLDRAELSAAAAAYLGAAAGLARAMQFDRALSLAERGCNLATASDAVVQHSLHLLRGQLLRDGPKSGRAARSRDRTRRRIKRYRTMSQLDRSRFHSAQSRRTR